VVMAPVVTLWSQETVDLETTGRIRYEGFHNSKVMDYATGLMDSIGEEALRLKAPAIAGQTTGDVD
ncbi:MAG: hypothetical protein WB776_04700, partial [Candidatus Sulfotelmatobacter sp.]